LAQYAVAHNLNKLVTSLCPEEASKRVLAIKQEAKITRDWLPLVAYRLLMPTRSFEHVFEEPQHKLMLRRILKACRPQFGVCIPVSGDTENESLATVGTEIVITSVEQLEEGSVLVKGIGARRFCTSEACIHDGYYIARVGYLSEVEEPTLSAAAEMSDLTYCQALAKQLKTAVSNRIRQERNVWGECSWQADAEGVLLGSEPLPDSPMAFAWAVLEALPVPASEKLLMMQSRTTGELFCALKFVLQRVIEQIWDMEADMIEDSDNESAHASTYEPCDHSCPILSL